MKATKQTTLSKKLVSKISLLPSSIDTHARILSYFNRVELTTICIPVYILYFESTNKRSVFENSMIPGFSAGQTDNILFEF